MKDDYLVMNNFASDLAINSLKALIDNCRCVNCDLLNLERYRFSCGHSVCEVCIETNNFCVLDCSPTSSNASPVIDKPQTERLQHASYLLKSFEDLFNVDVYRKQRISAELKAEKALFPKCIQAPIKYYNKRKSSKVFDKENLEPLLPGENIAYETIKMEKSKNYVQQWLNRLPLTDLSTNISNSNLHKNKQREQVKCRKRKLNKSACTTSTSMSTSIYKPICKKSRGFDAQKCQNHESGIELDDDICISDTLSILDKDKLAQRAVLEADRNDSFLNDFFINKDLVSKSNGSLRKENVPVSYKPVATSYKVPFYKRSILFDPCKLCASFTEENANNVIKMKNVTLTIDSPSFVTTIQITDDTTYTKHKTIGTQTQNIEKVMDEKVFIENQDVKENLCVENAKELNKAKGIIIEDSDCDSSDNGSSTEVDVKADIHRVCKFEDYVFKQLRPCEYENRVKSRVRGKTPASSDSSEKENYNPNRKKMKLSSKNKKRKPINTLIIYE